MSTPTASNQTPQQPGSGSKKAAGHVTTPSHLGLASPAPRSVPSPAATRKDHAGKTPINHPTASSTGSKTLGSTPMVPNLSQTGMSSSPGAHNASFGTPSALAGLGVDLGSGTPGQLSSLLAGGAAMLPTMSDLGLSSRSGKRNEDEERRDRMRRALKSIGRRKGRVSEDGIRRIGRRLGLDIDLDTESPEDEKKRKAGNRPIVIAGSKLLIELDLKQHVPQRVDVMIIGDGEDLGDFATPAGEVLVNDLKVPDGIQLHSDLDRFARNLNRLSRLDQICKTGKVNCFRAIHGLYKNLRKLYELETEAVKTRIGGNIENKDSMVSDEVLRKRSGKPTIHARERLGLALEYWASAKASATDDDGMEIDGADTSQSAADTQSDVYRLQIEAESWPAPMHTAIRISDAWLPETFDVPDPETGESLPWQDPPPTYMTETSSDGQQVNVMAVDGTQQVPDVRFVAKLEPPVVLPWNMVNVLSEAGVDLPPIGQIPDYYDALLHVETLSLTGRTESIEAEQSVLSVRDGKEKDVTHHYVLDVSKPDHGYKLEKVYFSHPRQLVSMLPILRQWAQVGCLIQSCFGNKHNDMDKAQPSAEGVIANGHTNGLHKDSMDIDGTNELAGDNVLVNIGLSILPQPTLSVTFPDSTSSNVSNTIFQIMPNASLAVTSFDGMDEIDEAHDPDGSQLQRAKRLATALDVCGDLGVWIEWMRRKD